MRNLRIILTFNFLLGALNAFFWTIYPVYMKELGLSGLQFGALGSIMTISSGLVSFLLGSYLDRRPVVKVLFASEASVALTFLLVYPGRMDLLVAYSVLQGILGTVGHLASTLLISRCAAELERDFPRASGLWSLGMASGAALGWAPKILSSWTGQPIVHYYRLSILWISVAYLLSSSLVLAVEEPPVRGSATGRRITPFLRILAVDAVVGFGAGVSVHNLDFYFAKKFNITSAELGTLIVVEHLIMGAFMYFSHGVSRRVGGTLRLYVASQIPAIGLLIALPFSPSWPVAMAIAAARTILMNMVNPIYSALLLRIVGPGNYGALTGARNLVWNLSVGPGRLLGGAMMDYWLDLPLFFTASVYSVSLLLLRLLVWPLAREGVGEELPEGEGPG